MQPVPRVPPTIAPECPRTTATLDTTRKLAGDDAASIPNAGRVTRGDIRGSDGLLHHHAGFHHALDFARRRVLMMRLFHVHLRHLDDLVLVVALNHEATVALDHLHIHHVRRHRSTPRLTQAGCPRMIQGLYERSPRRR